MEYIYILTLDNAIIGATCTKYRLQNWKDHPNAGMIMVSRYLDTRYGTDEKVVHFSLQEYLDNPNKQFK